MIIPWAKAVRPGKKIREIVNVEFSGESVGFGALEEGCTTNRGIMCWIKHDDSASG